VPVAYDFEGKAIFKKKFDIPEEIVKSHSFIFVAEGLTYESEIKINNNFIASHTGAFTPVIAPLSDGIIGISNEAEINLGSELNFRNTLPLSDQINYSKVYGGVNKDIYLIAVPKLYVLTNSMKYTIDNLLSVKIRNIVEIKSADLQSYLDTSVSNEFFVQTKFLRKQDAAESAESGKTGFTIGSNNSIKIENDLAINNPLFWTPEQPELYILKILITDKHENLIDEYEIETGFTNLAKRGGQIYLNGKQIQLNGINYYEDQPKYASALDYADVEKDIRNIKMLGFNSLRVPGRSAHPYIVKICNRLGLFLMEEIPFNELNDYYIDDEKYVRSALNSLADIAERDKNSPCIFAWGLGNDFDVSKESSLNYIKNAVSLTDSLCKRFTYYTTHAFNKDICYGEVDFTGINFYSNNFNYIKDAVTEITNKSKQPGRKDAALFVSAYGLNIENGNSNGYSDINSQEAQMKFLSETFPKISQVMTGNFISSYADWNAENPLNHSLDKNPYLRTNGLLTFNREFKRSADFVKKVINKEDMPRIQEGNFVQEFPYVFIMVGVILIVILVYFVNKDKKFRSGIMRCLYKPTYFFTLVKDQMIISNPYNIFLAIIISIGNALYFSSLLFYYRENNSFDMILAKIFVNDKTKIIFSEIVNNKFYLISSITAINLLFIIFSAMFLYFISFYTKGKSFFKNIFTISVWSTLPMLLFLFVGTIFYKLVDSNPVFIKISLWIFAFIYVLYLNRIIIGTKLLFDVRTGKVYLYGIIIIMLIFALIYSYFNFFTGAIKTIDLVSILNP